MFNFHLKPPSRVQLNVICQVISSTSSSSATYPVHFSGSTVAILFHRSFSLLQRVPRLGRAHIGPRGLYPTYKKMFAERFPMPRCITRPCRLRHHLTDFVPDRVRTPFSRAERLGLSLGRNAEKALLLSWVVPLPPPTLSLSLSLFSPPSSPHSSFSSRGPCR